MYGEPSNGIFEDYLPYLATVKPYIGAFKLLSQLQLDRTEVLIKTSLERKIAETVVENFQS